MLRLPCLTKPQKWSQWPSLPLHPHPGATLGPIFCPWLASACASGHHLCMLLTRSGASSCLPLPSVPVITTSGLQGRAAKDEWKGTLPPTNETTARDDSSEDSGSEGEREEEERQQHVASGWNSVVATTVWLRVLGILGDVSHLPHPLHREEALRHIQKTWILLEKVGDRGGERREGGEGRGCFLCYRILLGTESSCLQEAISGCLLFTWRLSFLFPYNNILLPTQVHTHARTHMAMMHPRVSHEVMLWFAGGAQQWHLP